MVLGVILFYLDIAIKTLSYMYIIFKIWRTKSCAGLSGKTHILYAVIYIARCTDFFSIPFCYAPPLKAADVVYLVFMCIIVLSLFVFLKKTREPQYDTYGVELPVICCLAVASVVNSLHRFELLAVLWAFSIYLEAMVMLPQFHMISEAQLLHNTHVFGYLIAITVGQFVRLLYLFCNDYDFLPWHYNKKLQMASIMVQLIISLNFFIRFSPIKLQIIKASPEISIVGDQETGDGGFKSDSLKDNAMSNIVLTPASLLNASANDKVNLLKDEEAK